MIRTSTILREENDFIEKGAGEAYQEIAHEEGGEVVFKFSAYQSLHKAIQWRVIQEMLGRMEGGLNMDEGEWSDVNLIYRRLQQPQASLLLELSKGLCLEKRYDTVLLKRGRPKTILPFEVELHIPGRTYLKEIDREVVVEERTWDGSEAIRESSSVAFLDYERLYLPLRISNFRPGDRFHPLGAEGKQKVKQFFIDHKIPKFDRAAIPLLISGDEIAWIAGHRIGHRFRITPETKRVLRVEIRFQQK